MVFFNCNACGESLKKGQVEKHYKFKCKNCEVLSCVDCGKEFWGDDYQQHTKCISEEEKYSGKNYVPKPNANKGEAKQELWLQQVQQAVDKVTANPQLKQILEKLKDYPNIPRKKPKFLNFLNNSLRVRGHLADQVWEKISAEIQQAAPVQNTEKTEDKEKGNADNVENKENGLNNQTDETDTSEKKLNKRERKEERRKKAQKVEKKHKNIQEVPTEEESDKKHKKKSKKRKQEEEEDEHDEEMEQDEKKSKKKSKEQNNEPVMKKRKLSPDDEKKDVDENHVEESENTTEKFNWEATIIGVLMKTDDSEISVKKLRKKVLAEYLSQGKTKSEEKLLAKFNKKINKNPRLRVLKDRVKLLH